MDSEYSLDEFYCKLCIGVISQVCILAHLVEDIMFNTP